MTDKRLKPDVRAEQILKAAVRVAKRDGFTVMNRVTIAKEAACSIGLVSYRWKTMPALRRAVMRHAVENKILPIVGQGLLARDKIAAKASKTLKQQAVAALT